MVGHSALTELGLSGSMGALARAVGMADVFMARRMVRMVTTPVVGMAWLAGP